MEADVGYPCTAAFRVRLSIHNQVSNLDISLFQYVESQTTHDDRRLLLALQNRSLRKMEPIRISRSAPIEAGRFNHMLQTEVHSHHVNRTKAEGRDPRRP